MRQLSKDKTLLDSSSSDKTKHRFYTTHRTFHFENVAKCARSNLFLCRIVAMGTFFQWAWVGWIHEAKWEIFFLFGNMNETERVNQSLMTR